MPNRGKEVALREITLPLVAQVRAKPNNLLYFLQKNRENPGHFIFYEIFRTQADFIRMGILENRLR